MDFVEYNYATLLFPVSKIVNAYNYIAIEVHLFKSNAIFIRSLLFFNRFFYY